MTKEKLEGLCSLRREITRTKKRIAKIRQNGLKSRQSSAALAKLELSLEKYYAELCNEAAEITEYIKNIKDATVREIFMLRYLDGIGTWQKIAFEMGEYDESFVRKKHNAYLKKM